MISVESSTGYYRDTYDVDPICAVPVHLCGKETGKVAEYSALLIFCLESPKSFRVLEPVNLFRMAQLQVGFASPCRYIITENAITAIYLFGS